MNKVLIVLMFILLGTSLIVVTNMGKDVQNSFTIEYQNNKNLAMPDLTGATEISPNTYRIFHNGLSTVDYNVINGNYISNSPSGYIVNISINVEIGQQYTLSSVYVSGSTNAAYRVNVDGNWTVFDISANQTITFTSMTRTYILVGYSSSIVNDNYTFKLQLEKGSQATSYVVPKLIPVYKDNLTQQEKQEIGIGAFGGLSQIIRSVDNVIKPIGNFINGVLNLFK